MKRITKATVKKFIREAGANLQINIKSSFNGMTDSCEDVEMAFEKAKVTTRNENYTLGVEGAWFVGRGNDLLQPFEDDKLKGIQVYNSCGQFILAVVK